VILDSQISSPAVKYTFNTLLGNFLGLDFQFAEKGAASDSLSLFYGFPGNCPPDASLRIYCSEFWLQGKYLRSGCLPSIPLARYRGKELAHIINARELPVLFVAQAGKQGKKEVPYVKAEPEKKRVETNIDLIASSFFMLNRIEEIVSPVTDEHGRFPAEASLAFKEGFLLRPLVNEYVELLWSWLKALNPMLQRKERFFQLFLTHDVDRIGFGTAKSRMKAVGAQLVKYRSPGGFLRAIRRNLGWLSTSPTDPFEFIRLTSKEYGFKSHFFFLSNGKSETYDRNRYGVTSESVKRLIRTLQTEGHHVGLHCSYSSFLNRKQLMTEKKVLDQIVGRRDYGCRSHYLRLKIPASFSLLEECGFTFDSTLGYADWNGFRAGTCYPFKPFDAIANREVNLLEYPLMCMDSSLTSPAFRNLTSPRAVAQALIKQIDTVAYFNGCFVFLIHPDSLEEVDFPWRRVFLEVLQHCRRLGGSTPKRSGC
jgi:peptidoglycan/xylan/chitin deacetylase (PgdA/CDA1 family)